MTAVTEGIINRLGLQCVKDAWAETLPVTCPAAFSFLSAGIFHRLAAKRLPGRETLYANLFKKKPAAPTRQPAFHLMLCLLLEDRIPAQAGMISAVLPWNGAAAFPHHPPKIIGIGIPF